MIMAASVMLRHRPRVTHFNKLLRQSNINIVKFSSDSNEGDNKLSGLLSSLGKKNDVKVTKEPKLSSPKGMDRLKKGIKTEPIKNVEDLEPDMVNAAKHVAEASKDPETTESDLLKKLKELSQAAKSAKSENVVSGEKPNLANLFGEMKVERPVVSSTSRVMEQKKLRQDNQKNISLEQQAFLENRAKLRRQRASDSLEEAYVPIDLFGSAPLGIFAGLSPLVEGTDVSPSADGTVKTAPELLTWQRCADRELSLLSAPAPRNALEEQIEWTLQGKLWHFPVNNEQGIDYSHEKFHEHLFLDTHIKSWCPTSGPVRHFMELVCVGLSKNPYVSVQYKKETLDWFRSYFNSQEINEILVHRGAWEDPTKATLEESKP
jgi:small subunit ribosomal protein S31